MPAVAAADIGPADCGGSEWQIATGGKVKTAVLHG